MGIMFSIVYQRVSLKLWCVCCGRAGGNGQHSLDAFELKTSPPPPPPPYLLLISILLSLPVRTPTIRSLPPPLSFSLSKVGVSFGAVLKKSKKRQAKTLLLKIRSTPIALAALPASFFRSRFLPYVSFVS